MDEATLILLRQARNLPILDQFEFWEALSHALFEDALTGEGSFDEQPVMTLDARVAALDDAARTLGQAAVNASRVSRSADATVHALAARHHDVHRERDGITWECMDMRDYPLTPGEFAADDLGAVLGVTSSRAEAMATDAERLRHCLRPLFVEAGAGRARMSSVLKVSDALDHLDDEQIAVALPHLLRAKAVGAGPRAASNRTAGVLDALGLAQDADEIDLRAELGVWFTPHPEHPTLTELRAVLPAGDAASLKAAVFAHAQELRDSAPHVLDGALHDPIGALRADALTLLALANVHVTPALHLQVPVARSQVVQGDALPASLCSPRIPRPHVSEVVARVASSERPDTWAHSPTPDALNGPGGPDDLGRTPLPGGARPPTSPAAITPAPSASPLFGDVRVPGIGTITGAVVEQLARVVGAVFTAELVDPMRWTTVATSTQKYRPSTAIRTLVERRDGHCRFPWCSRPAAVCDADHIVPFDDGGETSAANLQMLCRHHHRAKTFGGWAVQMSGDGTCTWQAPSGPMLRTRPNDAVPHAVGDAGQPHDERHDHGEAAIRLPGAAGHCADLYEAEGHRVHHHRE